MSFPSPAAGSRFLPAVTDTVYGAVLDVCILVIVKIIKPDRSIRSCQQMETLPAVTDTVYGSVL